MKKTLLTALLALAALGLKAQQADPVVIEVGGQRIRQSELMKDFMQSVGDNLVAKHGVTAAEKRKALDEYVDLYAIFRAKVIDARAMGLDTASDLQAELMRYRAELAAPTSSTPLSCSAFSMRPTTATTTSSTPRTSSSASPRTPAPTTPWRPTTAP